MGAANEEAFGCSCRHTGCSERRWLRSGWQGQGQGSAPDRDEGLIDLFELPRLDVSGYVR